MVALQYLGQYWPVVPDHNAQIRRSPIDLCLPHPDMITLYDDLNYQGKVLPLTESVPGLDKIGFTSVASFRTTGGTWRLFEEANYQGNFIETSEDSNGVSIVVKSVKQMSAEIVLYETGHFAGASLTLTKSAPDLGSFNNKTSSVIVVSGEWRVYKANNYGGDSVRVCPGRYDYSAIMTMIGNNVISSVKFEAHT